MGDAAAVDSVIIRWLGNKKQVLTNVKTNQTLVVDIQNANLPDSWNPEVLAKDALFTDISAEADINYTHQEKILLILTGRD
jgi:hypothetical protein